MTKVKICGITNLRDALSAAGLGADALGFNFYKKSPRYISPEDAAKIVSKLPAGLIKVGVFVNEEIENIAAIAAAGLDAIQLHGDESPEFVRKLRKESRLEIVKAFRVAPGFDPREVLKYDADAVLLDAYSKAEYGGTGETFNWEIARQVRELVPKMYLAGGLSATNVADAIDRVKPYAVDACSLLESLRGKKDARAVAAFIANTNKNSDEIVAFIKERLNFLVTRYDFSISQTISNRESARVQYVSESVAISAYNYPARLEYGLSFSLIGENSPQFDVPDLISAEQLEISLFAGDYIDAISQIESAKYVIDRSAGILEEHGERVIRGDRAAYKRLEEDRDRRSAEYSREMQYDRLRKMADAAWHQHNYSAVVENYEKMKAGLSPTEKKKLSYAEKKMKTNE